MMSISFFRRYKKLLPLFSLAFLLAIVYSTVMVTNVRYDYGPVVTVVRKDVACPLPQLDPFHSSIKHLIKDSNLEKCNTRHVLLFNSTLNSTLVPVKTVEEMRQIGIQSCCYKTIRRPFNSTDDDAYELSKTCYNVSLSIHTEVPPDHEFLAIYCNYGANKTELVDSHAFAHFSKRAEDSSKQVNAKATEKVNVVVLGLDALSHMNFLRSMPKSYSFLTEELDAVGMNGYNSVGYNTFPNLVAALTSRSENETKSTCLKNRVFDECPFVWKNYSERGYLTSFGEDSGKEGGIFVTYWKGFSKPPTDFYFRPYGVFTEEKLRTDWSDVCYGPRLAWEVLLNYAQKLAYIMNKEDQRYFQFLWSTALTHGGINDGRLGDESLRSALQWFRDVAYLNQTVLAVISDHGARAGSICQTQQGQLEKRMPFVYFVTPPWFKKKYGLATQNLWDNRERLTTPFDLYETFADLANLDSISDHEINARESRLTESSLFPRGISLFLSMPLSRTCKLAGVEDHYCVCRNLTDISTNETVVIEATNHAVKSINQILSKYPQCPALSLASITGAKAVKGLAEEKQEQYQILFGTKPNNASFEATMSRGNTNEWSVSGTIDRTNLYGNQSYCVDDREAKLYCYCAN